MVAFKSGSILVLKTRFSKIQSIPMEAYFSPSVFDFVQHDNLLHHQKLYSSSISQSSAWFFWKALRWWCGSREGNERVRGHAGLSERSVADRREHVWMADAPAGANASLSMFSLSFWMPTGRLNIVYFQKNLSENVKLNSATGSRQLLPPFIQCFGTVWTFNDHNGLMDTISSLCTQ